MLPALCLSAGDGFQRCVLTSRIAPTTLHCRLFLKDLCHDRLAYRIRAGQSRLDESDAESAGAFDQQRHVNLASRSCGGAEWPAGIGGYDARRVRAATRMATG